MSIAGRVLMALLLAPAAVPAQEDPAREAGTGSVSGVVVDALTGAGLPGVLVTLEPAPGGLLGTAGGGALAMARSAETAASGAYRFTDVPPGRYRLRVTRLGYRSAVLEVEVRRPVDARVSVGLELEPVPLAPVHVKEDALPPFRRASSLPDEPDAARRLIERERQTLFVATDARALTMADVVEGVTLGETDVFRALQRFAGVSTRDDYTAELWTRGAPWSHTRVTFDGMPLFNPVHAVGVFSGVTPDLLGAVFFHPGHRSAALGAGTAGVVDLRSRAGGGHGELRGAVDVSMASAKLALDQRIGRAAWTLTARRSYLDVLHNGMEWLGVKPAELPYEFHDVGARVDLQLSDTHALEASALREQDRLFGSVEGILEGTTANWGNTVGQATLHGAIGPLRARWFVGLSHYRSRVQESGDTLDDGRPIPWVEPPADNIVSYARLGGMLEPQTTTGRPAAWGAGWEFVHQTTHYEGPEPRFHPVRPDTTVSVFRDDEQWTAAGWAELRLSPAERWTVQPGLRLEAGPGGTNTGGVRFSPRFALRYQPTPELALSATASRTWQYLQALALAGPSAHPAFHASQFWLLASDSAPALRSDLLTVGAEQWLGQAWLASVSAYYRRSDGVAMGDPRPGPLERRPLFVNGRNEARGLELGLRRIGARWSASLGYTLGESMNTAAGLTFYAPTDQRHRLDASAAVDLPAGFRLGLAYTGVSGAPYTRVKGRLRPSDCSYFGFGCPATGVTVDPPNEQRTDDYHSLDAILMLTHSFGGLRASAYVQLRNVLDRRNAITYSGSVYRIERDLRTDANTLVWTDRFERGLPRLPLLGARIVF